MSTRTLDGKNVLVAGGAKNLGGLVSRLAADQGANVALHYNSADSAEQAEETADYVRAQGGEAVVLTSDLTVPENVEVVVRTEIQHRTPVHGDLRILIAGNDAFALEKPGAFDGGEFVAQVLLKVTVHGVFDGWECSFDNNVVCATTKRSGQPLSTTRGTLK